MPAGCLPETFLAGGFTLPCRICGLPIRDWAMVGYPLGSYSPRVRVGKKLRDRMGL